MNDKTFKISIFSKVVLLLLGIIVTATVIIGVVTYNISSKALKNSVSLNLDTISADVANNIVNLNEKHFSLIEGLAKLDVITDENVSLAEKSAVLTSVRK
ncbi:MAG: hypothetical protein II716_06110, partial [Treponema sp.]|nr:hypothetical protein [Treponema sp.]